MGIKPKCLTFFRAMVADSSARARADFAADEKVVLDWLLKQPEITRSIDVAIAGEEEEAIQSLFAVLREYLRDGTNADVHGASRSSTRKRKLSTDGTAPPASPKVKQAAASLASAKPAPPSVPPPKQAPKPAVPPKQRPIPTLAPEQSSVPSVPARQSASSTPTQPVKKAAIVKATPTAKKAGPTTPSKLGVEADSTGEAQTAMPWVEAARNHNKVIESAPAADLLPERESWIDRERGSMWEPEQEATESLPLYWKIDLPEVSKVLTQRGILPSTFTPVKHPHTTLLWLGGVSDEQRAAELSNLPVEQFMAMQEALEALQGEDFEVKMTQIVIEENVACQL